MHLLLREIRGMKANAIIRLLKFTSTFHSREVMILLNLSTESSLISASPLKFKSVCKRRLVHRISSSMELIIIVVVMLSVPVYRSVSLKVVVVVLPIAHNCIVVVIILAWRWVVLFHLISISATKSILLIHQEVVVFIIFISSLEELIF